MEEIRKFLLESLKDGPKLLSLGRSPPKAITEALAMEDEGLMKLIDTGECHGWRVSITIKGEEALKEEA